MKNKALGIFETIGFVPALTGADAALKSAEVELLGCRYVGSGLVSVLLSGDVSSVKVAVESGCSAAQQVGSVKWRTVIARTAEGLDSVVEEERKKGKKELAAKAVVAEASTREATELTLQELSGMRVIKLRELARQVADIALDKRKIRSARKDELIDAIISCYRKHKE